MIERIRTVASDEMLPGFLLFAGALGLTMLVYFETTASLMAEWTDNGNYGHGLLAIAVSLYLLWQKRDVLNAPDARLHPLGLLIGAGFGFLWLVASFGNVLVVQQVSLIAILNAVALALYGPRRYLTVAFPLLTIFLVTPMWNYLQQPLRELSTVVTYAALQFVNLPVLLEGYQVTVPGGRFLIEPACSGLGFFLCSGLIGAYFAYFNQLGRKAMLGFVTLGLALAVVSNWMRIVIIIMVGNATRMEHFIVQDHLTFGWLLFSAMLIPYFWAGNAIVHRWHNALAS